MKKDLSSVELYYVLKEFQVLIGAKVEQIYQLGKEELILQLHVPSIGKKIVRIVLGNLLYIASNKGEIPEKPHGFCLFLRRRLKNSRLRAVGQMGFERVVEFSFETKDAKFIMVVEMFGTGNIVLCGEDHKIISVLERHEWKDRSVKPGVQYLSPGRIDIREIGRDDLKSVLVGSDKENLVKALAMEFGLGGVYAEEVCLRAAVEKSIKPNQLSDTEYSAIFESIKAIFSQSVDAHIFYVGGDVKDIVPFGLKFYSGLESKRFPDYSSALDSVLTKEIKDTHLERAERTARSKIDKVNLVIEQQKLRIDGLEKSERENQRKGEIIYENYPLIKQILDEVNELRKKSSWKEVQEVFRGHRIVKSIDDKTGDITVEI